MKKCHYCGEEFDEELTVCPACGKEQPENTPAAEEAAASPDTPRSLPPKRPPPLRMRRALPRPPLWRKLRMPPRKDLRMPPRPPL